jgi:hypothetical protein
MRRGGQGRAGAINVQTFILVPGGGGSKLKLGDEEIWPPTPLEFAEGYGRIDKLMDGNALVTGVFYYIACYEAYQPLWDCLNDIVKNNQEEYQLVDCPYDWRKSYFEAADRLASTIQTCVENGSSSIALVCHSSGNLAARLLLESRLYSSQSWFKCITKYVSICGPHFGVPRILQSVLGLKDFMSIPADDLKRASADCRYPGCYQCLPFEVGSHPTLFDVHGGPAQQLDFYIPAIATKYKLSIPNLSAANAMQSTLGLERPPDVQYSVIAGQGQTTLERIEYDGLTPKRACSDALGDSMVPLWTSQLPPFNAWTLPCDHMAILMAPQFQMHLYAVLTGVPSQREFRRENGVTLSVNDFTFAPGEDIHITVLPDYATAKISGKFELRYFDQADRKFVSSLRQPVDYDSGKDGPRIESIRLTMKAPQKPGIYRLGFTDGSHESGKTSATFVVSEPSARR